MYVPICLYADATTLCEHGPFPYQPTKPHSSNEALADIEVVNDFVQKIVTERFNEVVAAEEAK